MSASKLNRFTSVTLVALILSGRLYGQTEGIEYDPETGTYTITYVAFGDSLREGLYIPGNVGSPSVSSDVTQKSEGGLEYSYTLINGANAIRPLAGLTVSVHADVTEFSTPDSNWHVGLTPRGKGIRWDQIGPDSLDLAAGDSLSGFGFVSPGLPAILKAASFNYQSLEYGDEGPSSELANEVDSLVAHTGFTRLFTIAPRDPPTPFNLGDFLDTLGTYPLRAAAQGWIGDSTAAEFDRLLNDASSALSGGDSTWAATLLGTVLNHVEAVKDDSLSSEGYALMKYNIEHALGYLPDLVPVKVFLHGPYVSGVMSPENGDTPTLQPFCDPSLPFNYDGSETVTKFPSFAADWIHVMLIDTTGGWTVEHARPALVSKTGFAFPSFPSSVSGDYILAVGQYNHVAVASDTPVTIGSGSAGHDFTLGADYSDGNTPQKSLGGGIYGMWAADGNQDGQVTAPDFNLWNAATTQGATGYHAADYNRDQIVTAPDFNLWNANTSAGARNAHVLNTAIHAIPTICSGLMTFSASATSSFIRLTVIRDDEQEYWVNVEARAHTSLLPNTTLGSGTIDVAYDASVLSFQTSDSGVLTAQDGYTVTADELAEGSSRSVRLNIRSAEIGVDAGSNPGHDLATDWEVIGTLHFGRATPGDGDVTVSSRSLSLGFFDSPSNENGSNNIVESIVEIQ